MKKVALIGLLLLFTATGLHAADIDVDRTNLWSNVIFKGKLSKHWGMFARYSSRYNIDFEKEKNGTVIDDDEIDSWLNEFFVGPYYTTKLTKNLSLFTSPQYRPMFFFADGEGGDSFRQDTIHWPTTLTYKWKKIKFMYRLILWARFSCDDDPYLEDDELLSRHYFGINVPFIKKSRLFLGNEIFWLHTDDSEDGQEALWRNAIWAGIVTKTPIKNLKFKLAYVNYYTNKDNGDYSNKDIDVNDHYIKFDFIYNWDFTKKKK